MTEFIEFGWNVMGFLFASMAVLFVAGAVWMIFTSLFDWLADYCDKQGWNG